MSIAAISAESHDFSELLRIIGEFIPVDIFEDGEHILEEIEDIEAVCLDLDSDLKSVDKLIKKIRKIDDQIPIFVLCNSLDVKKLSKHQKSKAGADLYFTTPLESDVCRLMLEEYFDFSDLDEFNSQNDAGSTPQTLEGESAKRNLTDASRKLVENVFSSKEVSARAKECSDKLDSLFGGIYIADYLNYETKASMSSATEASPEVTTVEEHGEFELSTDDELNLDDDLAFDLDDLTGSEETPEDTNIDKEIQIIDQSSPSMMVDLEKEDISAKLELASVQGENSGDSVSKDYFEDMEAGLDLEAQVEEDELSLTDEVENELSFGNHQDDNQEAGTSMSEEKNETLELSEEAEELGLSLDGEEQDLGLDLTGEGNEVDLSLGDDDGSLELAGDNEELNLSGEDEVSSLEISVNEDLGELDLSDDTESSESESVSSNEIDFGVDDGDLDLDISDQSGAQIPDANNDELSLNFNQPDAEEGVNLTDSSFVYDEAQLGLSDGSEVDDSELSLTEVASSEKDIDFSQPATGEEHLEESDNVDLSEDPFANSEQNIEFGSGEEAQGINNALGDNEVSSLADEDDGELDFSGGKEGVFNNEPEDRPATAVEQDISTVATEPSTAESDSLDYKKHYDEELFRLGETIKSLRQDREILMEKLQDFEQKENSEHKDFLGLQAQLDEKKVELEVIKKRYNNQLEDLKIRVDVLSDKKNILEQQNSELKERYQKLSVDKKVDMNKIRHRERELEEKLEMLRSDAEIQIKNRDMKILELKRRIDTLEFDIEAASAKKSEAEVSASELEDKMSNVIKTLRSAISQWEDEDALELRRKLLKDNLDV